MRSLLTLLIGMFLTIGASAQVFEKGDFSILSFEEGSNFYFNADQHNVGAGASFLGSNVGVEHRELFGEKGLYFAAQLTPNLVSYKGIDLIGGGSADFGNKFQSQELDANAYATVGLRWRNVEVTHKINGHSPVSVKLYID